jgi:GNAT superfamily N-acetyltransferase
VKTEEVFYARDKAGDLWCFVIETHDNSYSLNAQILGYPLKEPCTKDLLSKKCCYARIDTQVYRTAQNCLIIVDTIVHPDYRNRHIGKFIVKEAAGYFEKKGLRIDRIRGKLGYADETTEEDKMVRDTFWQSMGFVINQRQIMATRETPELEKIKTHRITEREYMLR